MATRADVRRIALALLDVEETAGRFTFSVMNKGKAKGFVWGFPAILVRLDAVTRADLKVLIAEAWRCQAPPEPSASKSTRRK